LLVKGVYTTLLPYELRTTFIVLLVIKHNKRFCFLGVEVVEHNNIQIFCMPLYGLAVVKLNYVNWLTKIMGIEIYTYFQLYSYGYTNSICILV